MKKFISEHKRQFVGLLDSIIVTDGKFQPQDMDDGIITACSIINNKARNGGKAVFIGNGGSAAIASHMSIDFWNNGGVPSICFNDGALLTCISNDYGYQHVFERPINMFLADVDVLIAISSSGRSENIIRGVQAAVSKGCSVVTLSGFNADNPLRKLGECNFYVPAGEYGLVEVAHQYICHLILDTIVNEKKALKTEVK